MDLLRFLGIRERSMGIVLGVLGVKCALTSFSGYTSVQCSIQHM